MSTFDTFYKMKLEDFHINFSKDSLDSLRTVLQEPKNITVVSHSNPDGDALGSALAMKFFLNSLGHEVTTILPDAFPSYLEWMPDASEILLFEGNEEKCLLEIERSQLIIGVDFNNFSRLNGLEAYMRESKTTKVLIDHHPMPEKVFDIVFSVTDVSSTAELIFHIINTLGFIEHINKNIADCLFVGIMTDTGSFSFSSNNPATFQVAAKLIEKGTDNAQIHNNVYDTFSESRMRLLGFCLRERLVVRKEFGTAYIYLSKKDLIAYNYTVGDIEGVVNYALAIKGISFAALFTERNEVIRVSFRSKGEFSVNDFAREHFDGGGHKNAAGGNSYTNLPETLSRFNDLLTLYADKLIN